MRILVNAASANMGGAVTYLQNVLRWLPKIAPEDHFIFYVPAVTKDKLGRAEDATNVQVEAYPYGETGGLKRLYFDQVLVPRLVDRHKADAVFSSTGFGTFFSPCPQVLLVRNPVYFSTDFHSKYRELGRSLRRNSVRRKLSLLSIRQADVVLFPTMAMQEMISPYMNLDGKQTHAIHYGFDREAFTRNSAQTPHFLKKLKRWKEDGYHIVLNVSTYAVHKNFETLIEAFPHIQGRGLKVKLITTTSREKTADKEEYDVLLERAEGLGVREAWEELGYVPYEHLRTLYAAADVYVFPSFTESFGHSLVEAMASGLPVVAADMPVNREVCGEAGRYFQTFDALDCADAIAGVLCDVEGHSQLAENSIARAKHFSWKSYVEQLIDIFHQAAQV